MERKVKQRLITLPSWYQSMVKWSLSIWLTRKRTSYVLDLPSRKSVSPCSCMHCSLIRHTQTHALPFYWFDFHAECKGMHYENIQNLVTQMREDLDQGGFFQYNLPAEQVLSLQNAVVRTNCIDCLDRMDCWFCWIGTNVVQSVLARDCLFTQLFGEKAAEQIHRCL